MPDFPIVDAHVHLHGPSVMRYRWMAGKPGLDGLHGSTELDEARGPVDIQAIVWVEVGAEQLRPYLDHAIDCFGFARVMFGSDWPVSELTHCYPRWVEVVGWAAGGAAVDGHRQLFCDRAIALYRLDRS